MGDRIQTLPPLRLETTDVEGFLASLERKGRQRSTVAAYATKLSAFLGYASDGLVRENTLARWRESLLDQGYSAATANSYLSAANGLMSFLGRRDLQFVDLPGASHSPRPTLTRVEYLSALSCARSEGRERDYLLVKSMATLGLSASSIDGLTVESLDRGVVGQVPIPESLDGELRSFVTRRGIAGGPIFCGRDGAPLSRSSIAATLRGLASRAGICPERLGAGAIASLRAEAIRQIERDLEPLVARTYGCLLDAEQAAVGWGGGGDC